MSASYLPHPPDDGGARVVGYVWTGHDHDGGARGRTLVRVAAQREGLELVDLVTDTAPVPDLAWLRAVVELRTAAAVVTPNTRLGHVVRFVLGRRAGLPVILAGPASAEAGGLPEPDGRAFAGLCADWLRVPGETGERWRRWQAVQNFRRGGEA